MSPTSELPPYEGGPLHNPGTPGREDNARTYPFIQQRLKELTGLAEKKRQDELRTLIREELHRALFPGGLPDAHRHRRVRLIEENGTEWRGTLYATEESTISEETPESKEHQG